MIYNGKHHRNPSGHNNRVKWLLRMCNWNSAHLGDVFQYIKDPTPQGDNDAHFVWKKRWVEAYKEAQLWIKIGGRYYRKQCKLEKQVERMKCCGNCIGQIRSSFQRIRCPRCKNRSDWRLAD